MTLGCFLCNGPDHWAANCETTVPPKDRKERWCFETDPPRITPHQKRALIEHENAMWKKAQKEKEKAK
jgi:hypothetical protein